MENNILAKAYLKELEAEYTSTKKCLERIPESTFEFKPHPKSMNMGYLCVLVAEIPRWISYGIEKGGIEFTTFKHDDIKTNEELLAHFEENFASAKTALSKMGDSEMEKSFSLKNNGQELMKSSMQEMISSTINHWAHHRGQLTVYMRLNDIAVPSIYGPSADEKNY